MPANVVTWVSHTYNSYGLVLRITLANIMLFISLETVAKFLQNTKLNNTQYDHEKINRALI